MASYRLFRREKNPSKWADPEVPEFNRWLVRVRASGREIMRSTGTDNRREAEMFARALLRTLKNQRLEDAMIALEGAKLVHRAPKRKIPTIGEIIARYESGPQVAKPATMRRAVTELRVLVRTVKSLPNTKDGNASVDALPASILTRAFVQEYMRLKQGADRLIVSAGQPLKVNTSINSSLSHIRTMFSRRAMAYSFAGFDLGFDVTAFKEDKLATGNREWTPIPDDEYEAMDRASRDLRETHPRLYLVNQLCRQLGLRNQEIIAARDSWLEQDAHGWLLVVKDREEEGFYQKGVRARRLPLSDELVELLVPRIGQGHLVPAKHKTDRINLVEKEHNRWLKKFIKGRGKGNHELRKHIGSVIYAKHGLEAAADYLGHVDPKTTRTYYQARLERLPTICPKDIEVGSKVSQATRMVEA